MTMPVSRNRVRLKVRRKNQTKARRVLRHKDSLQQAMNKVNAVEAAEKKEAKRQVFLLLLNS